MADLDGNVDSWLLSGPAMAAIVIIWLATQQVEDSLSPSVCVSFSSPSLLCPSPSSFLPPLFPFPQISLSSKYINLKEHTLSDMQEIDECKDH